MTANEFKPGDHVRVVDLRDGATVVAHTTINKITFEDLPGQGRKPYASLAVGWACSLVCLRKLSHAEIEADAFSNIEKPNVSPTLDR